MKYTIFSSIFQDPVRLDANVEGGHNSVRQFTKIQIGEDVDQIDYVNTTSGRVQPTAEETNEVGKFEIILKKSISRWFVNFLFLDMKI